ncbi:CCA tRNA nucleotidyltransferase [Qipengyuania zhejiangensis]|uniref:CCA tRNA nucleotidyltransferase n=1 Tax=Qipengyuania zhejiangensis TaxID=3077782 RepID=UPI002D79D80C|nr:CCA tRNA nucleotidyltransferase [Qipengyuania sp. Z2]
MADTLPAAQWTQRADLAKLVAALGMDHVRWVGGCVRDTLLGIEAADIDCATTHRPGTVIDLCRAAGIRTVPTGIDHGTITALLDEGNVEVTTLRQDVSTDGRRATVAFANDWREDAARRDFTINALYAHPASLEVSDYFGGLDDLAARRVRFIGDARERIAEDHLRILRYFRFQARFGDRLDEEALGACRELAGTLKGLSRERVAMELLGILSLPDPVETVQLMDKSGVLAVILPEARRNEMACLVSLVDNEQAQGRPPEAIRRLAALIPPIRPIAEAVAARLRLSRAQRARLVCAAERSPDDADTPRALAYREGLTGARDRLLLAGADASVLDGWDVPRLPLKGGEVVARGVDKGPRVAQVMQAVEARWIAEEFPPRSRVEVLLEEELSRL